MLSQVTRLLAVVSAPAPGGVTVRHVEVLLLQPHVVMVVVITSTGGVTKRALAFDEPLDQDASLHVPQAARQRVIVQDRTEQRFGEHLPFHAVPAPLLRAQRDPRRDSARTPKARRQPLRQPAFGPAAPPGATIGPPHLAAL